LANRYFILGIRLAIVAGGIENGKNLSDFPEFAEHVKRLAGFRTQTEQFWVDGTFQDDIGLQATGAFAKIYQTNERVVIMAANLQEQVLNLSSLIDQSLYGIRTPEYSVISSNGKNEHGVANSEGKGLRVSRSLGAYEMVAVVFARSNRNQA